MTSTPIDTFKRSLSAATKALSGEPELEVSYGGDVAGIVRDQVMLPSLPPKPKPFVIAKVRGEADGLALRLSLHDRETHQIFSRRAEGRTNIQDQRERISVRPMSLFGRIDGRQGGPSNARQPLECRRSQAGSSTQ